MTAEESWRPDWKDVSKYPPPQYASSNEWAWEFLRRNPQYQADYERSNSFDLTFANSEDYRELERLCSEYALTKLTKPSSSYKQLTGNPFVANAPRVSVLLYGSLHNSWTPEPTRRQMIRSVLPSKEYELTVKLDLSRSLEEQMRQIEQLFQSETVKAESRKQDSNLYIRYLQILDAKTHRVSDAEIARQLEEQDFNRDSRATEDRIRKQRKAAMALVSSGYKNLICLDEKRSADAHIYDLEMQ